MGDVTPPAERSRGEQRVARREARVADLAAERDRLLALCDEEKARIWHTFRTGVEQARTDFIKECRDDG